MHDCGTNIIRDYLLGHATGEGFTSFSPHHLKFYGGYMARPKGITKAVQSDRRIIAMMDELKKRVSDDVVEAYQVMTSVMRDTSASATARKGAAETVIKLHNAFYKEATGENQDNVGEESEQLPIAANGNLLRLSFEGDD